MKKSFRGNDNDSYDSSKQTCNSKQEVRTEVDVMRLSYHR